MQEFELIAKQLGQKAADSFRREFGEPPDRIKDGTHFPAKWAEAWGGLQEIRELGVTDEQYESCKAEWLSGFFGD